MLTFAPRNRVILKIKVIKKENKIFSKKFARDKKRITFAPANRDRFILAYQKSEK